MLSGRYAHTAWIMAKRHLCFNCTGASHRATDCPSKSKCLNCEKRHQTSICDRNEEPKKLLSTSVTGEGLFPVVLVKVNGIKDKLLAIDNPSYEAIIARYSHLSDVKIGDDDKKASLPVHVVLSGGEYVESRQRQSLTSERTANRSQKLVYAMK